MKLKNLLIIAFIAIASNIVGARILNNWYSMVGWIVALIGYILIYSIVTNSNWKGKK